MTPHREDSDLTCCFTHSQYTNTRPTAYSTDTVILGVLTESLTDEGREETGVLGAKPQQTSTSLKVVLCFSLWWEGGQQKIGTTN